AEAIEMAVRENLEIEIEKAGIASALASERGATGFLDPVLGWSPRIEDRTTPTSSSLAGVDGRLKEKFHTQDFSYDQRLPWWGAGLNVSILHGRQSTPNPFTSLTPFVTSSFRAQLVLPLVRNREIDQARANLTITNKQVGLSETQFETKVIDVVARLEEVYWNLVAARQAVEVSADTVKLAREQLARTQRMIDSGTLAPVEIAAAEAELERRVDTWYATIGVVTEVENALKMLITSSHEAPLWDDEIVPTVERTLDPPRFDHVRDAVEIAVGKRPELRSLGFQLETNEVQRRLARNQVRPQVNLVGGYVSSGLAGQVTSTGNPFGDIIGGQVARINELSALAGLDSLPVRDFGGIPADQIGGYGSALSNVVQGSFPTTYAGLQFNWTGRNRAANAQLTQTAVAERRLALERSRLEQFIAVEVRNALQAIETARQRITPAEASARAATEKLESEIRLFRTGESTNFLVLTRQNELADSRQRAVVARL
ncbi:MAG: TolC family protein, partial [bacterium]|nr:TolC family protein [bacterium]